ncbi:sugar kinase [Knoellia alttitudinis]|uniref:sugar kinase n=1 Tax=Knoellia altitudinis TaxID=3404795 RepID=UPI00361ADEA8
MGESMAQVVPQDGRLGTAEVFRIATAGAESNVAAGLAALGLDASWVSAVGADPLGERVVADLAAKGVDTSSVLTDDDAPTGVFFKDPSPEGSRVHYYRAGSAASRMDASVADVVLAAAPTWVHVSGVTSALSPSCRELVASLLRRARSSGVRTTFDVNYRPRLWGDRESAAAAIAEAAALADTVLVGLDEAQDLWHVDTPEDIRALLPQPETIVVKDGSRYAVRLGHADTVTVPALAVDVVEPVGAGDAFAAGWIAATARGADAATALRLGHLVAGRALLSLDDHPELTDREALLVRATDPHGEWPAETRTFPVAAEATSPTAQEQTS